MARLAEIAALRRAGLVHAPLLLGEYYLDERPGYEAVCPVPLGTLTGDDATAFVAFCLTGMVRVCREVREMLAGHLREVVLSRYFEELRGGRRVTARQFGLLRMLLGTGDGPVRIQALARSSPFDALYGRASEQTARRDLKRLYELGLLVRREEGFVLDRGALDAEAGEMLVRESGTRGVSAG